MSRWRDGFAAHVAKAGGCPGFDVSDDATWPDNLGLAQAGWTYPVASHPKFASLVVQLGGGKLVENRHTSNNASRWPAVGDEANDPTAWVPPAAGHIDGYGPGGWSGGFTLGVTTMLTDVRHAGGAFVLWPRSHRAVHRYFVAHPEQIDGSFSNADGFRWDTLYKSEQWSGGLGADDAGLEVIADAGDICLCQSRRNSLPRAFFCNLTHRCGERRAWLHVPRWLPLPAEERAPAGCDLSFPHG